MGKIVICGDSFAIGIGCLDLEKDAWGPLLGNYYSREVINFGKGSSTNYSISLQADYAIDNVEDIDLLIISNTCPHRINFFKNKEQVNRAKDPWGAYVPTNLDVNYHEYPPYGEGTYIKTIPHPYINNPEYKGNLNTENWHGVICYTDSIEENSKSGYYRKFKEEDETLLLLRKYYFEIFDLQIQQAFDNGVLLKSYLKAVKKGIPVLLALDVPEIVGLVEEKEHTPLNWGDLALEFPDKLNTWHTSEEGHSKAFQIVRKHIDKFRLLSE